MIPKSQQENQKPWWLPGFRRVTQRPRKGHPALDLSALLGSPILAPAPGRVKAVRWDPQGYGLYADIEMPGGGFYRIAHMRKAHVQPGQHVLPGQLIGEVGSTGRSTGPHVHLEVRGPSGQPMDPEEFLRQTASGAPGGFPLGTGIMLRFSIPAAGLAASRAGVQHGEQLRDPGAMLRVLAATPAAGAEVARARAAEQQMLIRQAMKELSQPAQRIAVGAAGLAMMLTGFLILAWGLRSQVVGAVVGSAVRGVTHAAGRGA